MSATEILSRLDAWSGMVVVVIHEQSASEHSSSSSSADKSRQTRLSRFADFRPLASYMLLSLLPPPLHLKLGGWPAVGGAGSLHPLSGLRALRAKTR